MAFLRHCINTKSVSLYELGEAITLGRAQHCHIQLDDSTVSAEHMRITPCGDGYEVRDLGSTNGILVNGEKTTVAQLKPNDVIAVGTNEFEYLLQLPKDFDKTQKIKKSWIPGIYYTE